MKPLVEILPEKCTNCFACIRSCPVKAIQTSAGRSYPEIVHERCIGCGACIESCAPDAINYRDSINDTANILKLKTTKIAIVSPSISAEFEDITDYRKFVSMIKALGFNYVHEESFGADLIAYKYMQFFNDFKGRYYITSCDPVVVSFVEKFHPNLVTNLAPFVSPMVASAKVLRQIHGVDSRVVYIGPNLACKNEALNYSKDSHVDAVLIFPELRKLFREFEIDENTLEFSEFDPPLGYKGSLYPLSNGLIQAADIDENLLTTHVLSVEGKDDMIESIEEFENNVKIIHRNLHVTFGNLIAGLGISNKGNKLLKEHLVIKYANKRLMNFFRAEWYDNLQKYLQIDFSRTFKTNDQRIPEPAKEQIEEALKILTKEEDEIHDCSSCGYSSCKAFAIDMAKGIVIPEMCSTYAVRNSQYYSDNIKELNDKLASTRRALKESEEKTFTERDSAKQASELADSMLENLRAGIVIVDYKLKVVKANNALIRMLGEEAGEINSVIPGLVGADLKKLLPQEMTNLFSYVLDNSEPVDGKDVRFGESHLNVSIFPIRNNQIAGGIIRDMRAPEVQKAEVTSRISEVIDKNLEMVQKIGFLLGESASDIEKMLNSIIEFYKDDLK